MATILNFAQVMVVMGSGYIFKNKLWMNTSFDIMFMIFFWYGQSMVFFAFFMSTLMKTENQACNTAYAFVLTMILFDASFSYGTITLKLTYNQHARKNHVIRLITFLLERVPTFQFSILYGVVAFIAAPNFEIDSMSWVLGRKFLAEDYYAPTEIVIGIFGDVIIAPSPQYYMHTIW